MKSILVAIATAIVQCTAFAAPPTNESVERLLEITNAKATLEQAFEQSEKMMRNMARQAIGPRPLSAAEVKSLDVAVTRTSALMKEEMSWEKFKPDFVRLYVNTFTQEELDSLIAFYSSPAGQAFIKKMPAVIQGSMELSQSRMNRIMPKLMQIVQDSIKQ